MHVRTWYPSPWTLRMLGLLMLLPFARSDGPLQEPSDSVRHCPSLSASNGALLAFKTRRRPSSIVNRLRGP